MAIWLHPSVTSTIVDNSGFYATADGVTTAFFPGFFQKGKDNELITVDGPTDADLVKKFGNVDAIEYGQNHLNLVNWLVAGGSAIVMRCLPDNAKYAHAILEVLTKTVSTDVYFFTPEDTATYGDGPYEVQRDYDVDGNFIGLIYYDSNDEKVVLVDAANAEKALGRGLEDGETASDFFNVAGSLNAGKKDSTVNVVPKITYVPSGVSKKETIEAYISNKQAEYDKGVLVNPNSDGYARHILGYFIPEGRGAIFYNDVRININLVTNYDNTYDFRVYSLQFEKYDSENEEWGVIYGPFYVSFDETARDFSDETMFIGDVLDKYCAEFTFVPYGSTADEESGIYNAGFYSAAKAIAGSNVSPRRVDILSCQEYYSEADETYSNIHKNAVVNGGVFTLRKDILDSDLSGERSVIYLEKNVPIVGATLIIADGEYEVKAVNATDCSVTLDKKVVGINDGKAYSEEDLALMEEDSEEKLYAETVLVLKDVNGVVYANDINDPASTATVKTNDKAIERVTGKKYKFYLNKNGADFYKGQEVSVTFNDVMVKGDNPDTKETIVLSNAEGTTTIVLHIGEDGVFHNSNDSITARIVGGKLEVTNTDGTFTSTDNIVKDTPIQVADYTALYSDGIEDSYHYHDGEGIVLAGTIADIIDIDNAIEIEFTVTNENREIVSKLDKFDSSAKLEGSVFNALSDGITSASIKIEGIALPVNPYSKYLSLSEGDYAYMQFGSAGDSDTADGATRQEVATARKNLLIKAFRGTLNPAITMKKFWPFDIVLDANYDASVKNAINELTTSREDFMFMCDTGFCATPEQAIEKRIGSLTYNNRYTAIFTQDMRVYDEYTSKNIKVTPTYFLAKKIPYVDRAYGIHYAFVGPNRGEIEGMVEGTLSWNPTEAQKEKLYKKQLNYIQFDPNHLMFMGQLTSQKKASSLSDIPNVRALLMIRRNIENICEEYYFERINENLLSAMSNACNNYLGQWIANGTLSEGNVSVYASEYDMKQKLVRVQVELKFTSFLERVVITFTVK